MRWPEDCHGYDSYIGALCYLMPNDFEILDVLVRAEFVVSFDLQYFICGIATGPYWISQEMVKGTLIPPLQVARAMINRMLDMKANILMDQAQRRLADTNRTATALNTLAAYAGTSIAQAIDQMDSEMIRQAREVIWRDGIREGVDIPNIQIDRARTRAWGMQMVQPHRVVADVTT